MTDTLDYLGGHSIGACIPGVMTSVAIGKDDLEGRIAAMANFKPAAVDIGAQIALAEQILADLHLGVVPPSIDAQVAAVESMIAALTAQLAIILKFYDLCAAAGVDAYWYDGATAGLGPKLTAALSAGLPSGGTSITHCDALVLAATAGATATAMKQVFISP